MKGFIKLIDIHDQAERLHKALEKYLDAHSIPYRRSHWFMDGFYRYSVKRTDLGAAQAGLPALRELAGKWPGGEC